MLFPFTLASNRLFSPFGYVISPFACFHFLTACRSVKKGAEAVKTIEEQTGIKDMASVMALDLSSFESINSFSVEFKLLGIGLDLLVNSTYSTFVFCSAVHFCSRVNYDLVVWPMHFLLVEYVTLSSPLLFHLACY